MKTFYITTPIYYASGDPHIGHAYTNLMADITARYHRMGGHPVLFLTGTDEHGMKVQQKAQETGQTPQVFVDEIAARFRELTDVWNITNDDFIRTTEDRHKETVRVFWQRVMDAGYIYKKKYGGLYCVGCESFKTEKDLVEGKCTDHDAVPEQLEEENYFFQLSAFQKPLEALFDAGEDFVTPADKCKEMRQILASGLEDISVSRSTDKLQWGIPVPGDESQVLYVWFDALVNYVSAIGFGRTEDHMKDIWPADIHFVGKEINRFHSLLWPAMLLAAGLQPPKQIAVHGWITVDGKKMSKTIGNVLDPFDLVEQRGLEAVRYFLAREIPFYRDGDFSFARFEDRYNNDLANELGNLLHRAVAMTDRYVASVVPAKAEYEVATHWTAYRASMEDLRFDDALAAVWELVRELNKYIDTMEPWKLGKQEDKTPVSQVLYVLLESLRHLGWMLMPIMPETSMRLFEAVGTSFEEQAKITMSEAAKWGGLKPGSLVVSGEPLFPRMESVLESAS
ncbi:TPA: methionine--tRNA ligase [Candidatus Uhrbacteria bacterium]|nr:methionine--tRNA ligase [Candidatus Uhrbacteria bacterium]